MKRKVVSLIICAIVSSLSISLAGCGKLQLEDDYIIQVKENTDAKPSGDKVNDVFDSDKISELMDKLKSMPADIADKLDEVDSDTENSIRELTDKADELTDKINSADLEGKSDDIKSNIDEMSDKLDDLKDKVDDAKDRADDIENPIDKEKVTDTLDEFRSHMNNLESALNRLGNK